MNSISEARRLGALARKNGTASRLNLFQEEVPQIQADWTWADPASLAEAIANWVRRGGAITLGATSDGGALSITLLEGGEKYKLYAADDEMLAKQIAKIRDAS